MTDPRAKVVGEGYDAIGERFDEWRRQIVGDPRERWLEELTSRLFEGARVLELGCGSGLAETQLLAKRFRVTGVDVSATQIRRARVNLPEARFVHADFTSLELPSASFEAVASFYSFNHTTLATNQRRFSYVSRAPGAAAHFRLAETGDRHIVDGQGLLADQGVDDPGHAQPELPHCPRPDEEERSQREGGEGQKLDPERASHAESHQDGHEEGAGGKKGEMQRAREELERQEEEREQGPMPPSH